MHLVLVHLAAGARGAAPGRRARPPAGEPAQRGAERDAAAAAAGSARRRRATTPRTGGRRWRCSSRLTCTRPPGRSTARPEGSPAGATPALERHHLGVLHTQALPGGWRARASPPDFFSARALLEALLDGRGHRRGAPSRGGPPFLHPGRAASSLVGDAQDRLGGRGPPAGRRGVGPGAGRWPASRSTSTRWSSWRRGASPSTRT